MSYSIEHFVRTIVEPAKRKGKKYLSEEFFYRNPNRPQKINSNYFYAPSDGIIIGMKEVMLKDSICEIKGEAYTLDDAMGGRLSDEDYGFRSKDKFLVVEVFLTMYHVHYTRVPYGGIINTEYLPPILTQNLPMLSMENDLLKGIVNMNNADYLFNNYRAFQSIYNPKFQINYFVLNIADYDVNAIISHHQDGDLIGQNDILGAMQYGSQVTLIVPKPKKYDDYDLIFNSNLKVGDCIEGGLDYLIEFIDK
jgi:phosphatidylserine decarboxylase